MLTRSNNFVIPLLQHHEAAEGTHCTTLTVVRAASMSFTVHFLWCLTALLHRCMLHGYGEHSQVHRYICVSVINHSTEGKWPCTIFRAICRPYFTLGESPWTQQHPVYCPRLSPRYNRAQTNHFYCCHKAEQGRVGWSWEAWNFP